MATSLLLSVDDESARRAYLPALAGGQLIDAVNGGHLWADKYDRELVLQNQDSARAALGIDEANDGFERVHQTADAGTSDHHQMLDRPGPAATTRWPLLSKQHSAHPRTDQAHLDVARPAENNQPPS